jgi:hypothetical protein
MISLQNAIVGRSTDTKPSYPSAQWTFLEADTGKFFTVIGGVWVEKLNPSYTAPLNNFSTTNQVVPAATRTYLTGTKIAVPPGKLRVGTMFRWTVTITKTAAGTAASTYDIAVGVAGTTADTARVSFTKPAGTAAVDEGKVVIEAIVRSIGVAGVMVGEFTLVHNLATTGHATRACVLLNALSAGFDTTVANLFVGLCLRTGAADAITTKLVLTEVFNL